MSPRHWKDAARGAALVAALTVAACDSGPKGPGVLNATVEAPQAVGAVVLEFTGMGVRGFEAQGNTQVYSGAGSGGAARQRVILVTPTGSTRIRFGVELDDRGADLPSVVAVSAVTADNVTTTTSGLKIRIER